MIKTLWVAIAALAIAVGFAPRAAQAVTSFDMGAASPTGSRWVLDTGWGSNGGQLNVAFSVNSALDSIAFALEPGDSQTFQFGSATLISRFIIEPSNLGLSAVLALDQPAGLDPLVLVGHATAYPGAVIDGTPELLDLSITFDPVLVVTPDAEFTVELAPLNFYTNQTLNVTGKVTLVWEAPPPPVFVASPNPEPATALLWLLAAGAGVAGFTRHRQRS